MDSCIYGLIKCGHVSVFQFWHLVKVSVSVNAWLGMVEPPWKRLGAITIVPWKVGMIKTEKVGMEYGWLLGGLVFGR
jgi:hypothetical protein